MNDPLKSWGPCVLDDGSVRFRVWAPSHAHVDVRVSGRESDLRMLPANGGWHELVTSHASHGSRYRLVLPDGSVLADPASSYQPLGVMGPSEVVDLQRFQWSEQDWQGRPWHEAVIYELHVGTFTTEGTFRSAIERLPHLAALGITAIELMPLGSFAGIRNWGYDGVLPYAPAACYGRPEDLQTLVDAAHTAGLMVFLDVVYNHFGPAGNYLPTVAPGFLTERHHTPWGAGFNFDGELPVRQFFVDNAIHWLRNYRLDGLRLDAVHAIADDSTQHIIEELAAVVRTAFPQRHLHLIIENEENGARLLERDGDRPLRFTAQWNDDVHHVLHVAATGDGSGYYADYLGNAQMLARALAHGFAFQGEFMPYRSSARGEPSAQLPPVAFISFIQNHDQIGNRAFGERLTALAPPQALRAIGAIYLLAPQIPMLFMGEEWDSTQPFPFFCDFDGELGQAVVKGRRDEFARFPEFADPAQRARIPDPLSEATFDSAKLQWNCLDLPAHAGVLDWYTRIIAMRHREIVPRLPQIGSGGDYVVHPSGVVEVTWTVERESLVLTANLSARPADHEIASHRVLWQEGVWEGRSMSPWCVQWALAAKP